MEERIAVIGLGYVGFPIALAFAKRFPGTVGFDISARRVESLRKGVDVTREVEGDELRGTTLNITDDPTALRGSTFYVVAVPTPIDDEHRPDMVPLVSASEAVGAGLTPGAVRA